MSTFQKQVGPFTGSAAFKNASGGNVPPSFASNLRITSTDDTIVSATIDANGIIAGNILQASNATLTVACENNIGETISASVDVTGLAVVDNTIKSLDITLA